MGDCDFRNPGLKCPACGFVAKAETWRRNCPAKAGEHQETTNVLPLGDYVEAGLSAIGITKDRVANWLGGCGGCPERQKKLNQIGDWISRKIKGEAVDEEIDASGL